MTWPDVVPQFAARRDALRPVHDQRRGDAAFVRPDLVPAERRVAGAGPARPKAQKRRARAGAAVRSWPSPRTMSVASAPLSDRKKMTRVVQRAHAAELVEHAPDLPIHAVHHRGVDGHLRRLEPLLLVRQLSSRERRARPRRDRACSSTSGLK